MRGTLHFSRSSCIDAGDLAAAGHANAKALTASAGSSAKASWRHHFGKLLPDQDCSRSSVQGPRSDADQGTKQTMRPSSLTRHPVRCAYEVQIVVPD